jgi:hypothetical protein
MITTLKKAGTFLFHCIILYSTTHKLPFPGLWNLWLTQVVLNFRTTTDCVRNNHIHQSLANKPTPRPFSRYSRKKQIKQPYHMLAMPRNEVKMIYTMPTHKECLSYMWKITAQDSTYRIIKNTRSKRTYGVTDGY